MSVALARQAPYQVRAAQRRCGKCGKLVSRAAYACRRCGKSQRVRPRIILLGLAGARWPLAFHVEQVSGYWLPLYVPWLTLWIALGASLVIGAVASALPARRAARINVLEAITYE